MSRVGRMWQRNVHVAEMSVAPPTCCRYSPKTIVHAAELPGLNLYVAVRRETTIKGIVYYISSLLGTAVHVYELICRHWRIESMHWLLDVTFHEDALALHNHYLELLAASGD